MSSADKPHISYDHNRQAWKVDLPNDGKDIFWPHFSTACDFSRWWTEDQQVKPVTDWISQ